MKNRPIVIMVITLAVIAGVIFLLIKPVISSIWSSWKNYNQTKENIQAIEEKKQVFESLKNNQDLTKVASVAEKYIPKDQESGQLIIELTAMAQSNNLKIEQTSIEKSKDEAKTQDTATSGKTTPTPTPTPSTSPQVPEAKSVDFTMKINGTFSDFMNFLKAIEGGSRLIILKQISMQSKTEANQAASFSVQISGSAYYSSQIGLENTLDNIKISEEILKKFLNLKSYGQPINLPGESGFGRTNPFENY